MNILIYGANSFLAIELSKLLKGHKLWGVINRSSDLLIRDIFQRVFTGISELFESGQEFDVIYIIGSYIPDDLNSISAKLLETNVSELFSICKKYSEAKFIFCSSVSVYGFPKGLLNEEFESHSPTRYGLSKISGELIISSQKKFSILRFSSLWGKNMRKAGFLPLIVRQAKETREIKLFGDGSRKQNYLHVSDAAMMLVAAMNFDQNRTFLGVYPKSFSNLDVARVVSEKTGAGIVFAQGMQGPDYEYDAVKTYVELAYLPKIEIADRIDEVLK